MLAVIKTQELAGIDVVADGELYRWDINHAETNGMIDYFLRPMDGIRTELTRAEIERWRSRPGQQFRAAPPGIVVGPIGAGTLNLARDYARFRDLTTRPKKFTVTSPYMLAKTVADEHYGDLESLVMALAEVLRDEVAALDADVVQVDEANVTGSPQDGRIAAAGINCVLDGVRRAKGVHLCFGNYGGQTIQQGAWDRLVDFLNLLTCDHLVLEMARRPADELPWLRGVRPEIALGIGVIDIKDNVVERPEEVARRIDRAVDFLGPDRVRWVHPDCGLWMLPRNAADAKLHALVTGRDLFEGRAPSRPRP
jgi:5-methyltetrahydropteroyltriglutamate--homocysteine methyltransferase